MEKNLDRLFEGSIVRVLVDVKHYIFDEDGIMLLTHTDTIETNSSDISKTAEFNNPRKGVVVEAKEIRFYENTKSPIRLIHTIKLK